MSFSLPPAWLWIGADAFKGIQLLVLSPDDYEISFQEGAKRRKRLEMRPEQYRAVLQDYYHFDFDHVNLTYDDRHVIIRLDGERWARVPDIDLMRLENLALSGSGASMHSGLNSDRWM